MEAAIFDCLTIGIIHINHGRTNDLSLDFLQQ